jgi:hypothetical protein
MFMYLILRVEGDLTVAAGHKLTLFDADIIAGNVPIDNK